jgi:hypothetical protein
MIIVFIASWIPNVLATITRIPFPPLTGVYLWLPYAWMVWTAIGLIWYFSVRASRPHVARAVGSRYEAAEAEPVTTG